MITIHIEQDAEHGWNATTPNYPGILSGGNTFADALGLITDAIIGWADIAVQDGVADEDLSAIDKDEGKTIPYLISYR